MKNAFKDSMEKRLTTIQNLILYVYEAFLFIIFPLWIPNGYNDLAGDKYDAFMAVSIVFLLVLALLSLIKKIISLLSRVIVNTRDIKSTNKPFFQPINKPFLLILLFFAALTISTFISEYRRYAFVGATGWYMGYFTYVALFILMLSVSSRKNWNYKITFIFQLTGSFIVNIIAILNRFRIYPIPGIENVRFFISTFGNNNWYAGYLCLFLFLNIGIFLESKTYDKRFFMLMIAYITVGLFSMISCGNQSVYLFASVFIILIIFRFFRDLEILKKLLMVCICFGISLEVLTISYNRIFLWDDSIDGSMISVLIRYHAAIIIIALPIFLLFVIQTRTTVHITHTPDSLKPKLISAAIIAFISIPFVALLIQLLPYDIIPLSFGNGRGFIWRISRDVFYSLSLKQKLLGIGPDSLCFYFYSHPIYRDILIDNYGNTLLTNCHSILLNNLINWGIITTSAYLLIIFFTIHLLYNSPQQFSYTLLCIIVTIQVFGTVTFDHILYTPFIYYICGYCLFMIKNKITD